MKALYKNITANPSLRELAAWIRQATRERRIDLRDYNNQIGCNPKVFTRIPASTSDLLGTEQIGDIAANTTHLYIVVDNSGTLEWRRIAISTF